MVGPAGLPIVKLFGLLAKQISKPVASRLVSAAKTWPIMRGQFIGLGQALHWASVRILRISDGHTADEHHVVRTLSHYSPVAAGQASSAAEGESSEATAPRAAGKLSRGQTVYVLKHGSGPLGADVPMLLVEWWKGGERNEGWVKAKLMDGIESLKPVGVAVKPLPHDEALDRGTVFFAEAFVFAVAGGVALEEYIRKLRNDAKSQLKADAEREAKRQKKDAERQAEASERDEKIRLLQKELERTNANVQRLHANIQRSYLSLVFGLPLLGCGAYVLSSSSQA
mmetsp:Transcript_31253/g.57174  ORF Transcript_31253/g.57174 Transcript_31253/m.57174 type:complete len:283 (-) Transcript_31253:131-979(-)